MSRFLKIAALLVAALWVPATLHCRLESLGFDTLFAGADHSDHGPGAACDHHHDTDGCQSIESGQFAAAKVKLDLPALVLAPGLFHLCLFLTEPPVPTPVIAPPAQDETLPLQRTWRFAHRAVAPARAPGLDA